MGKPGKNLDFCENRGINEAVCAVYTKFDAGGPAERGRPAESGRLAESGRPAKSGRLAESSPRKE